MSTWPVEYLQQPLDHEPRSQNMAMVYLELAALSPLCTRVWDYTVLLLEIGESIETDAPHIVSHSFLWSLVPRLSPGTRGMEQNKGWWLPERRLALHRPLVDTTDMGSRIGGQGRQVPPTFFACFPDRSSSNKLVNSAGTFFSYVDFLREEYNTNQQIWGIWHMAAWYQVTWL